MNKLQREVYLALAEVHIPWPTWAYLDIVEPIAPGRAWATPWLDSNRDGWEQGEEMLVMDPVWCPQSLCHFCHYAEWEGQCAEAELWCSHHSEDIRDRADVVWGGDDCEGFDPCWALDMIAEFVSQRLQGKFVAWPTLEARAKNG